MVDDDREVTQVQLADEREQAPRVIDRLVPGERRLVGQTEAEVVRRAALRAAQLTQRMAPLERPRWSAVHEQDRVPLAFIDVVHSALGCREPVAVERIERAIEPGRRAQGAQRARCGSGGLEQLA